MLSVKTEVVYKCGHGFSAPDAQEGKEHLIELIESAQDFICPCCCREEFRVLEQKTAAYANLQQMSPTMSAFVIEVVHALSPLSEILACCDYSQRAPSLDETTPGGEFFELSNAVWRKEFWFANDIDPRHVVLLMDHVKQETDWLATYMPSGKAAVHFGEFAK
ncbi:hypothetical protein [Chitinibacter tainanensis]|uniref:hypothetical protein n=1 Tax=Chitinibacter tainanensis TaxID=230667 RepID=UPI00040E7904|nr:hypothetical protein [Chitinibacter tainanensis]